MNIIESLKLYFSIEWRKILKMKTILVLCIVFGNGFCFPMFATELNDSWSLFKHVFNKEYISNEEEIIRFVENFIYKKIILNFLINSRQIWEENLAMIRKHNLDFDLGIHTYTLEMNQFGDMVFIKWKEKYFILRFYFSFLKTNEEFRKQMNGYKMNLETKTNQVDRHTFSVPTNFILPDHVGKKFWI